MRIRLHAYHCIRINKMLSCAGADRLQTGMRHAFGKPMIMAARVKIGQVMLSVRYGSSADVKMVDGKAGGKSAHTKFVYEALRRCKFKFPGRQLIIESDNWGLTKFSRSQYISWRKTKRLVPDGNSIKYKSGHGKLDKWSAKILPVGLEAEFAEEEEDEDDE